MDSGFQILISLPLVLAKKDNWVAERPDKTLVRDALLRRPPRSVALERNNTDRWRDLLVCCDYATRH